MASDREDRWGGDDPRDDDRRPLSREVARSKVKGPAIGLIVVGLLTLAYVGYGIAVEYPKMDASFDEQIKQLDANPGIPADQKKAQKDMVNNLREPIKTAMLPAYGLIVVGGLLILFGGIKMKGLSGRGLAMTASILAMVPCFSGLICVLGIPIGIWALSALSNADVKAAFAGRGRDDRDEGWAEPGRT